MYEQIVQYPVTYRQGVNGQTPHVGANLTPQSEEKDKKTEDNNRSDFVNTPNVDQLNGVMFTNENNTNLVQAPTQLFSTKK